MFPEMESRNARRKEDVRKLVTLTTVQDVLSENPDVARVRTRFPVMHSYLLNLLNTAFVCLCQAPYEEQLVHVQAIIHKMRTEKNAMNKMSEYHLASLLVEVRKLLQSEYPHKTDDFSSENSTSFPLSLSLFGWFVLCSLSLSLPFRFS